MKLIIIVFFLFVAALLADGNIVGRRPVKPIRTPGRPHHHERVVTEGHGHGLHPSSHTSILGKTHVPGAASGTHIHPHARHNVKVIHKDEAVKTAASHSHPHPVRAVHGHSKIIVPPKVKMASSLPHHSRPHAHSHHVHSHGSMRV